MTVLLLGSTGRIGPHTARSLLQRGATVRVLTRDPIRAKNVLPTDVEIIEGSYQDVASNLSSVSAVLLLSEHGPQMQETQMEVLKQITDPTIRIVKISGSSAIIRPDGPDAGQQHWEVEQALAQGNNPWVILRPNAFMQTLVAGTAATVKAQGFVANPIGNAGIAMIDAVDIGEVTASALRSDGEYDRQTLMLTGPAVYTYPDVAKAIQEQTGQDISVKDVTPDDVGEAARSKGATDWEATHLGHMLSLFAQGLCEEVSPDVQRIVGRAPRALDDYISDNLDSFTDSTLVKEK